MFGILGKSLATGIVTTRYPATPPDVSARARGRPEIDWPNWKDARPAAAVCPTGAIECRDQSANRSVTFDLAKCIFCGLCAEADRAIRMTNQCECAARRRSELVCTARYALDVTGTHRRLVDAPGVPALPQNGSRASGSNDSLEALSRQIQERADRLFGRSLHIREVDAGSCNGCEVEIQGLNSPVYDLERFGVHFVASPRHADLLLVTGPVTRNMELALRKTYDATPEPRRVVAVGACGCSGGIFGVNYATRGAVDAVIPVDLYIPGCPPNPHALLHGILEVMRPPYQRRASD
jgi:Ni,Fe-hydrogenase III small subunit/formate hydrogenlyase subunit 6/NADH:ubiquinone oxidoreductase subunit I